MRIHPRSKITPLACLITGFLPFLSADEIPVRLFDPGYLQGDCNYHSLTAASDGKLYFSVSTHEPRSAARLFRFDPVSESMEQIGDLAEILGQDPAKEILHGKIHTPLIEHDGWLYFSTHTSSYRGSLPNMRPDNGRVPYPGGHFMRYNLATGAYEDLANLGLPNEGIITMALEPESETLYGLTWPTGLLLSYNLEDRLLLNWGAVQQRGEWGHPGTDWNFICRDLAVDGDGVLYGSTDTGRIWKFDTEDPRPVSFYKDLDLAAVAPVQEEGFSLPEETHYFWHNWRAISWNPNTGSFWGIQGGSTQLFEFIPSTGVLRSVASLRADGVPRLARRSAYRSQLGFMLGPDNTLFYLAHAPGESVDGRMDIKTSVHLLTYRIDTGEVTDHGPLETSTGERVFFTESIAIGPDDHLYTVAWVESIDPEQQETIRAARGAEGPDETDQVIYRIQLVQLPEWQSLVRHPNDR